MEQQQVVVSEMAVPTRRPFDPVVYELDPNFRLTKFSDLKGLGCKLPRDALNKMLEPLRDQEKSQLEAEQAHFQYVMPSPRMGKHVDVFPGTSWRYMDGREMPSFKT